MGGNSFATVTLVFLRSESAVQKGMDRLPNWEKKKGLEFGEFGGDLPSFSSCPGLPSKLPVQAYQLGALQQALLIRRTNKRIEKPIKEMEIRKELCLFLSVFVQKEQGYTLDLHSKSKCARI